jgi:hypothetical protein
VKKIKYGLLYTLHFSLSHSHILRCTHNFKRQTFLPLPHQFQSPAPMKKFYTTSSLLLTFIFATTFSRAQLTVDSTLTATQLVNTLLGPGVTATNITMTGTPDAFAEFFEPSSSFGINHGILLTTGSVSFSIGPNLVEYQGQDNLLAGDALLDTYSGAITFDASILEFDFQCLTDSVQFRYVFGSEEYNEFVFQGFNDVFGFFISGPGLAGQKNIALVPATTTPCSIDSINNGYAFGQSTGPCLNCQYYVDNYTGTILEYDGYTTVLTAKEAVQPFSIYHIKIAIADATDGLYDSGVFLEVGSFSSTGVLQVAVTGDTICSGECTNIQAMQAGGIPPFTYAWNNGLPNAPGPFLVCPTITTTYSVTITDSAGAIASTLATVVVHPAPVAPSITQAGDTLSAQTGYSTYQWYYSSNAITGATNYFYVATQSGNYNLVITDINGCTAGAGIINVIAGLSGDDKNQNAVSILFNAVQHQLIINSLKANANSILLIHDATGKLIYSHSPLLCRGAGDEVNIDASTWRKGIYFYEMINNDVRSTGKFVVE